MLSYIYLLSCRLKSTFSFYVCFGMPLRLAGHTPHLPWQWPLTDIDPDVSPLPFHTYMICHHTPDKTCQFSCNCSYCNISPLTMSEKPVISTSQASIRLICICYHLCCIILLSLSRSFDLCPTAPLHIPPAASIKSRLRWLFPAFVIPRRLILSLLDFSPGARPR